MYSLPDFVRESNKIENILRRPLTKELTAHRELLAKPSLEVLDLEQFVRKVQPGASLRRKRGVNVRFESHIAPLSGLEVEACLKEILREANNRPDSDSYYIHQAYENLHPFTDGNGRSGRALWLWMRGGIENAPLGFLHHWYYDSLDASSKTGYGC